MVFRALILGILCLICGELKARCQVTQPLVAIHDSELTRALETMTAVAPTPTGPGTTGKQWWPTDWHYFVMPESMKEALKSDGTAFTVVGDSNIVAGSLMSNGIPVYPIVISLASEAIRDDEIPAFTNYVAAGGFLFVGSSAFTRNTNGTTRSDFAFANELGLHAWRAGLTNLAQNSNVTKVADQRISTHLPSGPLTWRMPTSSEEIPWGISPGHPFLAPHDIFRTTIADATVLASGDNSFPFLTIKPYGKGYFIYCSAFQPLIGHSGFAPSTYAYVIFRRAIEWAFDACTLPVPKISPWPYQYDAAFMVRHDLENFTNEVANIEASAQFEFTNNARGDYYFCTGTLRTDASPTYNTNAIVASLRRAVTNYGASIGPHNGGLKNPNNPSLAQGDYDYYHWALDEALDVSPPPSGYASGKAYAMASLSNAFGDIESWLAGTSNCLGFRSWVAPYFNSTREDSYDIQAQLNVKISGDQKISPFPHWTLSTLTPNKRYSFLSEPVSDWFVNGLVAQSLEPWHPPAVPNSQTMHDAVDFYYSIGALINFYSHTMSTGLGDAGSLVPDYITYCGNTNLHPRTWGANGVGVYQWWLQRSNVQMQVSYATNGSQYVLTSLISGSTSTNTAVEILLPASTGSCAVQVKTNGVLTDTSTYRTNGPQIKVKVGTVVTNLVITYYPQFVSTQSFVQALDTATVPALPAGWTSSASGAQTAWYTTNTLTDTAPNAFFCASAPNVGVSELVTPSITLPIGITQLTFRSRYDMDSGSGSNAFDGGVLELKIGTNAFADIISLGGSFVSGGYNGLIASNSSNPLAGRTVWSGNSGGYITTTVNLPVFSSVQTVQLRWRCGTDNSIADSGWRIDTLSFASTTCTCCSSPNTTPTLPAQSNRTMAESTLLTVTNTGSDSDFPPNTLTYTFMGAPVGAAISANGIITWTPSEAQGPSTNVFTTLVTDNGFPRLSATNTFTVVVTEVNQLPVLPNQSDRTISELTLLTVVNAATDPDLPANTLSYSLLNPPVGAAINSSGVITWTPSEAQGPGTNVITTVVTDNGSPPLSATNSFTVVVNEVNTPPSLPAQPDRIVLSTVTMLVTNTATDTDLPANVLNYSLFVAPATASISASGVISWLPSQNHTTNLFRTVVTDGGGLSATNSFSVIVSDDLTINLDSSTLIVEGCIPTNNVIDAGETVGMLFAFKNAGAADATNLVVTLLTTNGVFSPSSVQNYGLVAAGGSAISRPFTFTAGVGCGSNVTATFQLQNGPSNLGITSVTFPVGQTGTIFSENFDSTNAPFLPAGWSTSASGVQATWRSTNSLASSVPNAAFSIDATNVGINELISPVIAIPYGLVQLSFSNSYNLEAGNGTNGYDGGVLEIKIGTNAYADITTVGGTFVTGGYNTTIDMNFASPLAGRPAWSGNSGGYIATVLNLPSAAAGQVVQLRWRCGTDNGNGGGGWRVDTINLTGRLCCLNSGPVLPGQPNRSIPELSLLIVTNTAVDNPTNVLSYSLVNPPAGAAIDTNGVISWTPTEAQGPSANIITTIVTDNALPPLSATNSFTVIVTDINSPPVLPNQTNRTIAELTLLSVTNTASDADIPANAFIYTLVNPPAGALINTNGVISWTPTEAQGPGTNTITTVVTDNGVPALSSTNSFVVVVTEVNTIPTLPVQTNRTIAELTLLTVTNSASDVDVPANVLTYTLLNPPAGVVINTNGIITWTPTEAQGLGTNTITTVVTDNGVPALSATNSFAVVVTEVNTSPTLTAQTNRTIAELTLLTVTNSAGDADLPANALTYTLLNPPSGATIDTNGIITWTPTEAQGPGTNTITTAVTDNGVPALSATNSFVVVVTEVNTIPTLPVQTNRTIAELTLLTVTNTASDTDLPANLLTYSLLNPPAGAAIDTNGVITWTPTEAQGPGTNTITTAVTDNGVPALSATNSFVVVVTEVNTTPTLPIQTNRTIAELTLLNVTNTASDTDLPANALTYTLLNPPTGAVIDTNGVIAWTPTEAQGPCTNTITTVVKDNGVPALSVTNSFVVIVTEVNSAPTSPIQTNRTVAELTLLTVTNTASDADVPANALTYTLIDPPAGAAIDTNGVITWTPTEGQGPGTNTITTVVTDSGVPALSATNSFVVAVTEVNTSPTLTVQTNRTIAELTLLTVTNTASDADVPANALTYTLIDPPAGAAIDTNGVVTWTPTEGQGPGTNTITTVVTDSGVPALSATNSFVVVVTEVNTSPTLTVQTNRTIAELTLLTVTNTASDADVPANALTYTLLNPPAGAAIDTNGVITWMPTEAQGPGTNTITTVVTDNGVPALSATNSFAVAVTEVNTSPTLTAQTSRTIAELTLLTVTNTANDADVPVNVLTYTLLNPPAGAAIDTNGVITWTPTETQGPCTNTITTVVTDNGVPALSATNSFVVVVTEVNFPPTLTVQTNRAIAELTLLTVTNTASDADVPANVLTYTLVNPPAGASIDTNGVIIWTPTEAQGPSTNTITTVVTDDGIPALSATNSFTVVVTEVNTAPVLPVRTNRTIAELTMLTVTNTAHDSDLPANSLSYSLVNPPAGAAIDTNGVFTWMPTETQGPSTNLITTVVTDDGLPPLSATNSFIVVVTEANSPPVLPVQTNLTIFELSALIVTNTASDSDIPTNLLTYSLVDAPAGAAIDTNGVITWMPSETQGPGTNTITTVVTDNGVPPLSATNSFTVVVVEVNSSPSLPLQPNFTVPEQTLLIVTNTAVDSDLPANSLTYTLINPPDGLNIDTNGIITWTPTELQGPGTNMITTVVTDNGVPPLSATNSFTVVVTEMNTAPILPFQSDRFIAAGGTVQVTNTAIDADLPANLLTYSLLIAPSGANIDGSGLITWIAPPVQLVRSTNTFTTVVADNGFPSLSATNIFQIIVAANPPPPVILSLTLTNGSALVIWTSISGVSYQLQYASNLTGSAWSEILPVVMASDVTASVTDAAPATDQGYYRVVIKP